MTDVVITEYIDEAARRELSASFEVLYDPTLADRPADLRAAVAGARAIVVRNRTRVDVALLEAAGPGLRAVGRLGVGLDNIDVEACRARGVRVVPATGANVVSVAEYVVLAVLVLLRGVLGASAEVLAGRWPRERHLDGRETDGKTLGVVGFGAIGRAVAIRARCLGMTVLASDPAVPARDPAWRETGAVPSALDPLLAESDAVSVHVPLTADTRHLLDADRIARMRAGAVLVNTARGGVVDERALAAALREGHLAGAALDVFEDEPLPAGSHLVGVPNLLLTPHVAGLTRESNARVGAVVAAGVREALAPLAR